MNQNTEIALKQAFNLIEADQFEDARAVLKPILETEKDNPDVWWVYLHAVTDRDSARLALDNVLRLEPNYPGAGELQEQLDEQLEPEFEELVDVDGEPSFVPTLPLTMPGIVPLNSKLQDTNDDTFDEVESKNEPVGFYRKPLFYVPLISLLVIVALAIVIFKPFSVSSPTLSTSTSPTLEISVTNELATEPTNTLSAILEPTSTIMADSQVVNEFTDVKTTLAQFKLADQDAVVAQSTALGQTIVSSVCTSPGREMRSLLPTVMGALAKVGANYQATSDAIAVRMLDCASSTTLLQVGVLIKDASAFAQGSITEQQFQATWKPF